MFDVGLVASEKAISVTHLTLFFHGHSLIKDFDTRAFILRVAG